MFHKRINFKDLINYPKHITGSEEQRKEAICLITDSCHELFLRYLTQSSLKKTEKDSFQLGLNKKYAPLFQAEEKEASRTRLMAHPVQLLLVMWVRALY